MLRRGKYISGQEKTTPSIARTRKKQRRFRQFYVSARETRDRPKMTREDVRLHLTTSHFGTPLHIPGPGASMTHLIALRAEPAPTPPQPSSPTPGVLWKTHHLARNSPRPTEGLAHGKPSKPLNRWGHSSFSCELVFISFLSTVLGQNTFITKFTGHILREGGVGKEQCPYRA